jgi:predicted  nucleic acid-binding Zn-ribbon protein
MNLIGKILTLLILIASVCFLFVAIMLGAAQRNWKQEAAALQKRAEAATSLLQASKSKAGQKQKLLESEKTARALQLSQLESQVAVFRAQLNEKEKELRSETIASQDRLARLEQAEARLASQDAELATTKKRNNELVDQLANTYSSVKDLTNLNFEQKTKLTTLEELVSDLNESISIKTKVMNTNGLSDQSLTDGIVPRISSVVAQVGETGEFFAIRVGSDDGLREGHQLDVYRNDRYIGKGVITKVQPNLSVLQTVKGFMQGTVAEGDNVTSEL